MKFFSTIQSQFISNIWNSSKDSSAGWKRISIRAFRILHLVIRNAAREQYTLQAMGLAYTTLFSIVPVLAITVSVLKGFEIQNQLYLFLSGFLEPLGEQGKEIVQQVANFVENFRAGVLGTVGLLIFCYTAFSLLYRTEHVINVIWKIKKKRPVLRRFSDYLSIALFGPLFIVTAMALSSTFLQHEWVQQIVPTQVLLTIEPFFSRLYSYIFGTLAFMFIFLFMPNTHVAWRSALIGALLSGMLWMIVGFFFSTIIIGFSSYTAIYSAFAAPLLFMLWLYFGWLILLIGATIVFYHQNSDQIILLEDNHLSSQDLREFLALLCLFHIGVGHYFNNSPESLKTLSSRLKFPRSRVQAIVELLQHLGYVSKIPGVKEQFIPTKSPESIPVSEFFLRLREYKGNGKPLIQNLPSEPIVTRVLSQYRQGIDSMFGDLTLRDLILEAHQSGSKSAEENNS